MTRFEDFATGTLDRHVEYTIKCRRLLAALLQLIARDRKVGEQEGREIITHPILVL